MIKLFRIIAAATLFGIAVLAAGCGSTQEAAKITGPIWPSPPDTARVAYVRTFSSEDDFAGGLGSVVNALSGEKNRIRLTRPFDVCVADEGRIYVTDVSRGIFMFDARNRKVEVLGEKSSVDLKNPRGVAYGHKKVFISLASAGQIAVLDDEGRFLRMIGRPSQFPGAIDVVCDTARNRILIVDNKIHSVLAYSEGGDSLFAIGGRRGVEDGDLNYPQSAAVDASGNIYVVDAFNYRIQVFDPEGKFLRKFGGQGDVFGTFMRPKGIALDSHGNIYVLDALHQNYQIFNNQGELLMFVGKYSRGNDGFENPISIAIGGDDMIYVTDQLNSRVQVFRLLNAN